MAHGGQKLFVYGFDGVAAAFGQMGVPLAAVTGPLVALLEFFGGIALIGGLLTRLVSIGLAITMVGPMMLVHLADGFFIPTGVEFTLCLFGSALLLHLPAPARIRWMPSLRVAARRPFPRQVGRSLARVAQLEDFPRHEPWS